jgi:sporulation protein YlmC with PRC-barrel domain
MKTAATSRSYISSDKVEGTNVYSPKGDKIGSIDHLMIDKQSGHVNYAVMSFGGFLGMGESQHPVPWGALTYDTSLEGYRTNITEAQLRDAPETSDSSWTDSDWDTRMRSHYNVRNDM